MKSLEIVDELYDEVKHLCEYYIEGRWSDEKEIFTNKVMKSMNDLIENLQKNKQDLEMAKKVKEHLVIDKYGFIKYIDVNQKHKEKSWVQSREEREEIKKWLEEHE